MPCSGTRLFRFENQEDYLRGQVTAIRALRRKMRRVMHARLSNEEVAGYWSLSTYGRAFRSHRCEFPGRY